jgi:uncharacterized membrane protein YqjE
MTAPGNDAREASLRRLGAALLQLLGTRAELAIVELREEGERRKEMLLLALAAALFFALALLCASFMAVVIFWDTHRILALAGVTLFHAAVGAWALLRLRTRERTGPRPFEATLAELARDRELLGGARE